MEECFVPRNSGFFGGVTFSISHHHPPPEIKKHMIHTSVFLCSQRCKTVVKEHCARGLSARLYQTTVPAWREQIT